MPAHRVSPSSLEPTPRRSAQAVRRGFTLVEMIAVLVVVAVLAVSAVPAMRSLGTSRGRLAAAQLGRDVSYARERAVATGTRTWVDLSTSAGTWSVLSESPASPGRAGATTLTDPGTGAAMTQRVGANTFAGIAITSANFDGSPSIGFDWMGRPLNLSASLLAADGSAVLTGGFTVTVRRGTGFVGVSP